jgi:hypothetical protein
MRGEITGLALDLQLEEISLKKSALEAKLSALSHMTLGGAIKFAAGELKKFIVNT